MLEQYITGWWLVAPSPKYAQVDEITNDTLNGFTAFHNIITIHGGCIIDDGCWTFMRAQDSQEHKGPGSPS